MYSAIVKLKVIRSYWTDIAGSSCWISKHFYTDCSKSIKKVYFVSQVMRKDQLEPNTQ